MSPFTFHLDGTKLWRERVTDYYQVTGIRKDGRRFVITTASWIHASGINLWSGSRWLRRDGRRHLINRARSPFP